MFPVMSFRSDPALQGARRCAPLLIRWRLPRALQDTCREFASETGSKAKFGVFMDATHMVLRHARAWLGRVGVQHTGISSIRVSL